VPRDLPFGAAQRVSSRGCAACVPVKVARVAVLVEVPLSWHSLCRRTGGHLTADGSSLAPLLPVVEEHAVGNVAPGLRWPRGFRAAVTYTVMIAAAANAGAAPTRRQRGLRHGARLPGAVYCLELRTARNAQANQSRQLQGPFIIPEATGQCLHCSPAQHMQNS